MRSLVLLSLLLTPLSAMAAGSRPVLVELYSSDNCPSCPAADALLQRLSAPGAFPGVDVIALEWHTDFLNTETWTDRLALPEGPVRQLEYLVRLIHMKSPFLPQIIVGGRQSLEGSQEDAIRAAITADVQKPPFQITLTPLSGDRVRVRCPALPAGGKLFLAATETEIETIIPSGRHAGEPITHGPVVRWVKPVSPARAGRVDATEAVPVGAAWTRSHLRWVAWAQDSDGRVLGAGYGIPR